MPRYKKSRKRNKRGPGRVMDKMAHIVDSLAEYESFRQTLLPKIREDLQEGLEAEDILKKYQAYVAARLVSIALANPDASQAQAAAKDILNRIQGKPTENKKVEHKFENLDDKELEAILQTELSDLEVIDGGKK